MITAIVLTAIIWVAFFALMNREPSGDYGVNVIPIFQFGGALVATLIVWLIYFAVT
jgi:hypothetical protein